MKKLLLILFFSSAGFCAFTQTDTGIAAKTTDSAAYEPQKLNVKKVKPRPVIDTPKRRFVADTLKIPDSLSKVDSVMPALADSAKAFPADTVKNHPATAVIKNPIDSFYRKLLDNPYVTTKGKPIYLVINERERDAKDEMFYLLAGLLLFLAFIKLAFSRYFKNVFKLFFQPSFRQKQTREQLLQNNLPSLLLNLFFIFSGGAYTALLIQYYHLTVIGFWTLLLYTTASLLLLYTGKFIFLSFAGWVFNVKEGTDAYIFAVYLINKILGVILIPFTLLIAFSQPAITNVSVTISILIILLLFIYRYMLSYSPVRKEVKVSVLHFFLYILAFEITPILLIYKTLIIYMDNSV